MDRVPSIPEKGKIDKLPHWARVAIAARCARRLQPLLGRVWTNVSQEDIETIESAISAIENAAVNARTIDDTEKLTDDILCVLKNFTSYAKSQKVRRENHPGYYCIQVAFCAMKSVDETNVGYRAWEACDCCEKIGDLCYGSGYKDNLLRHIFWDLQNLKTQSSQCNSTPVPQGLFGPLWDQDKEPDWDKVANDMKQKMKDS
jgi:hypothetical protein